MTKPDELIKAAGIVNIDEPIPHSLLLYLIDLARNDLLQEQEDKRQSEDWEAWIYRACGNGWEVKKFVRNMKEHLSRYPSFMPMRVAEIFVNAESKMRQHYAYEPISSFTKSIHKAASMRSLADSQS